MKFSLWFFFFLLHSLSLSSPFCLGISLCSRGYHEICYVVQAGLKLGVFLPLPPDGGVAGTGQYRPEAPGFNVVKLFALIEAHRYPCCCFVQNFYSPRPTS